MSSASDTTTAAMLAARGLGGQPLRACDLVPGRVYLSPTGRKCMLLAPQENGISRTSYLFAYITRTGKCSDDDGFAINAVNGTAIGALREWQE
jgi:hypothetical protein